MMVEGARRFIHNFRQISPELHASLVIDLVSCGRGER
jgi:hypothetical protein